jgi:DNA-binding NarL/FixJ family response regulator
LLSDCGVEIVASVGDLASLLAAVDHHIPDVVVADLRMPPTWTDEGFRAASTISQSHPGIGVIVVSHYSEPDYAEALLTGSSTRVGYLLKDNIDDISRLVGALRRVCDGECVIDPEIVQALLTRRRRDDPVGQLSGREDDILREMASGRSNQGIAQALSLSEKTVEKHIGRVFEKLGLPPAPSDHRRVLAVLHYLGQD